MASDRWPRPQDDGRGSRGSGEREGYRPPRDPRNARDERYGDEPRYDTDARYADGRYADPRYADDGRYGRDRGFSEPGYPDDDSGVRYDTGARYDREVRDGRGSRNGGPAGHREPGYDGEPSFGDPRYGDPRYGGGRVRPPDPRNPRYAAGRVLPNDAGHSGDGRYPGPVTGQVQGGHPQHGDSWFGEPRSADPQHGDPRLAGPRLGDSRLGDPRLGDPLLGEHGLSDHRAAGRPGADPRYAGTAPHAGQPPLPPFGDPRAGQARLDPRQRPVQPRAIEPRRLAIEAPAPSRPAGTAGSGAGSARTEADAMSQTDPLGVAGGPGAPGGGPGAPAGESRHPGSHRAIQQQHDNHQQHDSHQQHGTQQHQQPPAPQPPGPASAGPHRRQGENTRAVHLPAPAPPRQVPLTTPVYRTTTFAFGSSADYAAVLADAAPGFSYSRIDNPTVEAFCAAVAALEGVNLGYVPAAQAFASGMAAISTVFWALTQAGSHVIAPNAVYGGTYSFLRHVAGRFGIQVDFVDMTDLARVRAAFRPGTSVVYAETLANPTVAVADLASLGRLAHEAGAVLVVDSTLAPPVICRPLEHGADLVLHSATKYFGGHSDVTGGVITGHPELIRKVRLTRIDTGGSLGPDDSYLLRRGLETLPLRVRRQCATAQVLAASLVRHPAVRTVYYPGLAGHPGHELARRQFDAGPEGTRFGAIVTVAPFGGKEAGMAFADRLGLARLAASLGGTYTKVSHVGSTTHRQMDDAALAAAGIDPGSVRFSVGLEDAEDLIADAAAALDSLGR